MSEKIRILYVSTKSVWGGAQKYVFELATELDRSKFDVAVAAGGDGALRTRLEAAGVRFIPIPHIARDVNIKDEWNAFWALRNIIRTERPDIIHFNGSKVGTMGPFAAKFGHRKAKLVFSTHGIPVLEERPGWQKRLILSSLRAAGLLLDSVVAISRKDYQTTLNSRVATPKQLIFIPISIQPADYTLLPKKTAREELARRLGLAQGAFAGKFLFGCIGEFVPNKNQIDLIRSVAKIVEKNPAERQHMRLLLIGWGDEEEQLRNEIRLLQLTDIAYVLETTHADAKYMKAFDTFVLPSIKEGLPYVLLEAALARVAMIATNAGGSPEVVIHRDTGALVPAHDVTKLAEMMQVFLHDEKLRDMYADRAFHHVHRAFSFHIMRQTTERLYTSLARPSKIA
jgi:glycosyltransferase involved in cell wall biosynthesis